MRIAVSELAHASAVDALVEGNQLAAQTALKLADRLASYAGMAGDDSTASAFAAAYDDAAAASVAAVESIVGAFASLARLVEASLTNHAHADAASVLPGWARPLVGPPTASSQSIGVVLAEPPSSLGASTPGPGGLPGLAFDALQNVFWPNADTDRVRAAATTWKIAATSLDLLTAHCDSAASALEDERSPEIPLALAVIAELRTNVGDLTTQLADLATACTDYADAVDAKRHDLLELLEDLVKELAAGAIVMGGISLLSGGTALVAGGGAGAARIASASAKFRGILDSLRVITAGTALQARPVAVTAGEVGAYTRKISRARVMLMEAEGARGSAIAGTRAFRLTGHLRPGWLFGHEGVGHTIERHVAKSVEYLRGRFVDRPRMTAASTFRSHEEAETAIEQTLRIREDDILEWLKTARDSEAFRADLGADIGDVLLRSSGEMVTATRVKVVLLPDETAAGGWRLITAHPIL